MTRGYVPGTVVVCVTMFITVRPDALRVAAVNVAEAPAGSPVTLNKTSSRKPFSGVSTTGYVVLLPWTIVRVATLVAIEKSAGTCK